MKMTLFALPLQIRWSLSEGFSSKALLLQLSLFVLFANTGLAQWSYIPGPAAGRIERLLSTPEAIYATTEVGVYKSTDGDNWQILPTQHDLKSVAHFVAADGDNIAISFKYSDGSIKGDLFYSSDGGGNFTKIRQDIFTNLTWWRDGTIALRNDTIYAIVEFNRSNLVRSTDAGASWDTLAFWSFESYDLNILPDNELIVYGDGTLMHSIDGGYTWTNIPIFGAGRVQRVGKYWFMFYGNQIIRFVDDLSTYDMIGVPFGDHTSLRFWTIGDRIYAALANQPGGVTQVKVSDNGGVNWDFCVTCGYWDYRCYDFTAFKGKTYAASNHGIWTRDSLTNVIHRTGEGIQAADITAIGYGGSGNWYAGTWQGFFTSDNNGASWTEKKWNPIGPHTTGVEALIASGDSVLGFNGDFSHSSDMGEQWDWVPFWAGASSSKWASDLDKGLLFVGGKGKIYRSTDLAVTADSIDLPPTIGFQERAVSSVEYRDGILLVATDSSEVFYSTDQGGSWQNFGLGLPQTADYKPMLWASRHGQHLIAMAGTHLMRYSIDAHVWEESALIIPNDIYPPMSKPVSWKGLLFSAVPNQGVYVSADIGAHWSKIMLPMPDLYVRTLQVIDNKLSVGVVGGIWQREDFDFQYFSGKIWADQNLNGTQDIGEVNLPEIVVATQNSQQFTRSDPNGNYQLLLEKGLTDTLTAIAPTQYCTVSPANYIVTQPDSSYHFGIYFNPDWHVTITNTQWPRIGFETDFVLSCQNLGPTDAEGIVKFVATPWFEFLEAIPAPSTIVGDTLYWLLPSTSTLETRHIKVKTRLFSNTPILEILPVYAWISFLDGTIDIAPDNNYAYWDKNAAGPFDPNNKSVAPQGAISPEMIADSQRLLYTVRFQNIGNAPATFVRIADTLDAGLDAKSIRLLSASHPVKWNFRNGRIVEFYFENINLPDSISDEPNSHGFVMFSIQVHAGLLPGEVLYNQAGIYFDFNPVVLTNIVETPIDNIDQIKNYPSQSLQIKVLPNPAANFAQISWNAPSNTIPIIISIFDIKGDRIENMIAENTNTQLINTDDLPSGVYFITVHVGDKIGTSILIKQ